MLWCYKEQLKKKKNKLVFLFQHRILFGIFGRFFPIGDNATYKIIAFFLLCLNHRRQGAQAGIQSAWSYDSEPILEKPTQPKSQRVLNS